MTSQRTNAIVASCFLLVLITRLKRQASTHTSTCRRSTRARRPEDNHPLDPGSCRLVLPNRGWREWASWGFCL